MTLHNTPLSRLTLAYKIKSKSLLRSPRPLGVCMCLSHIPPLPSYSGHTEPLRPLKPPHSNWLRKCSFPYGREEAILSLQKPVQPSHAGAAGQPSCSHTDLVMPSASTVFLHAQLHHLSPEPDAVTLPPSLLFSLHGRDRSRERAAHACMHSCL